MEPLVTLSDDEAQQVISRLERHKGTSSELYDDLHALGEAGVITAVGVVRRYLEDEDTELRLMALSVLTLHWGFEECWPICARMIEQDPDTYVRMMAAAGLGALRSGSRDPVTLGLLLRIFKGTDELGLRLSSYAAILNVLGYRELGSLGPGEPDFDPEKVREAENVVGDS